MACMITSQGVVIATAMVVSSTALFLAFSRQFSGNQDSQDLPPNQQIPRSCLYSEEKRKQRRKKKRVQFAENVKETRGDGEEYRREQIKKTESMRKSTEKSKKKVDRRICRNEIPANRMALYTGILRDRVHRTECTY